MSINERFLRIADRFLELIKRETGRDTIICDEHGIIVRSSIPSRIGHEHAGAKRIMRHEADEVFVTASEAAANPLIREGMNVPIVVDGRRIATFGIAGTTETSRPLVRVAAVLLANWIEEIRRDSLAPLVNHEVIRRAHVLWLVNPVSPWLKYWDLLVGQYDMSLLHSGAEALASALTMTPDVLLCDVDDPDLGGAELIVAAKGNPILQALPFIMLTREVSGDAVAKYRQLGAEDFIDLSMGALLKARVEVAVRASRTYQQLRAEQKSLEAMISHSARGEAQLRAVVESSLEAIVLVGIDGKISMLNATAERTFGWGHSEATSRDFLVEFVAPESRGSVAEAMSLLSKRVGRRASSGRWDTHGLRRDGREFPMECSFARIQSGLGAGFCAFIRDVTDSQAMEMELHQAQKLEAVGRLAAGIAHEINTPIQFIGDNAQFLREAFEALVRLIDAYADVAPPVTREGLKLLEEEIDLPYLRQQVPLAITSSLDGVRRVASIVLAMKEFAYPDQKDMVATDLNRNLQATLEVARNEYKYVAIVETDLGVLPHVTCHAGEMNQVFLNIIVNAAHAIADAVRGTQAQGIIRVTTRHQGDQVLISMSDTGLGIPEPFRAKVFEPFFTTKEVGRGTGQGLAITRTILAKHRGTVSFETKTGEGTTFHLRIPIKPDPCFGEKT